MESAIPLLIKRLRQLPNPDKVAVAFPDEGAWLLTLVLLANVF